MNLLHIREETFNRIKWEKEQINPDEEWSSIQKRNIRVNYQRGKISCPVKKHIQSTTRYLLSGRFYRNYERSKRYSNSGFQKGYFYGRKVSREIAGRWLNLVILL